MKTKPKLIIAALCTAISFNANANVWSWFGNSAGDDGVASTKGNGAYTANKAAAKNTMLTFGVVNNTNKILTSIILKDAKGNVTYQNNNVTCNINDVCRIVLNSNLINKGSIFYFYTKDSSLASAYMLNALPKGSNTYNAQVDMSSLGMAVLSKINALKPKVDYNTIDDDIITTSLKASPYEELADYYLDLLGTSKDDTAVIKQLANQFSNNKSVPANPKSVNLLAQVQIKPVNTKKLALTASPMVGSVLTSDNAFCSENFTSAMSVIGSFDFPGIGALAELAKGASTAACSSTQDYMAKQFDKIDAQFNEVNIRLDGLQDSLNNLGQSVTKYALYTQKQTIDSHDLDLMNWVRTYSDTLTNYKGADGKQYNTLKALIASYGGVNNAIKKNPNLANDLVNLYSNTDVLTSIQKLSGDILGNTKTQVNDICGNADTITNGVIGLRSWCNLVSFNIYTKNALLAKQTEYVYNDVNQVFNEDTRTNKQLGWKTMRESDFSTFANKVETNFNPKVSIIPTVKTSDSVYALVNNLTKAGFQIGEWYNEKTKRYITTSYDENATVINSKYYYLHPTRNATVVYEDNTAIDSTIVNVMGVPVPERFFNGSSGNNFGDNGAFPWLDYSIIAANSINDRDINGNEQNSWDDLKVTAYMNTPTSVDRSVYGFGIENRTPHYTSKAQVEQFSRNNTDYTRLIFQLVNGNYETSYYAADYYRISSNELFTFMRYTPGAAVNLPNQQGYSYVFAMRTKLLDNTGGMRVPLLLDSTMQCMTNNCTTLEDSTARNHNAPQFYGKIKFDNNMSIGWTKSSTAGNTHNSYRTYDMTVNGAKAY